MSDSCLTFLARITDAARALAQEAHHYSGPDWLEVYGAEAEALKRASKRAADDPFSADQMDELVRLAVAILRHHDTPPGTPEAGTHEKEMKDLVRLLQLNLLGEDASTIATVVPQAMKEGPEAEVAASRLKGMLMKLGKPTYDIVVKIISDIGSATIKKTMGL